jgi:hypothetical protein
VLFLIATSAMADDTKKPKEVALVNKAKDIHVISDRDEPILDCFRRNRILIGGVVDSELNKVIEAKAPLPKYFVNYASQNDDPSKASTFGATVELAPPTEAVVKLLKEHKKPLGATLILRRDDKKAGLYHVIGCTARTPVGFFDIDKKNETDGFSQKDLCFKGEPKK